MLQVIIVILFQRISELKHENIKLKLRLYQLEKDSGHGPVSPCSVKPEVPGQTEQSSWRSPVVKKRNAGPLYASTPSPLLGAWESPESVGLRGLEDEINELALQLAKMVLSCPVLEDKINKLALQLAKLVLSSPVLEVAVRNPRYRCSLTERPGASSS